jgi:hypothetical protein
MLTVIGNVMSNLRADGATGIYNQSQALLGGPAAPMVVTGNTLHGFDVLSQTAYAPGGDIISGNQLLAGPGPAISTAHPWRILGDGFPVAEVPEPASALLLATLLLAFTLARRRVRA